MKKVLPSYRPVNICFACDDNYAPYLTVTINSLICNADTNRQYDILILHKNISEKNQKCIHNFSKPNITIRFIDMSDYDSMVEYKVGAYYSIETNYRLFLFSEMFSDYDRIIYLDSDIIVTGDISKLFDTNLEGNPVGAVEEAGMRYLSYSKRALFIDNTPYNAVKYRSDALGMKNINNYFNAGVLLLDLNKCRKITDFNNVLKVLNRKNFHFNDQDTLNIIFDENVKMLDCEWNYQNNIEYYLISENPEIVKIFRDMKRENLKIIHYLSGKKPWNSRVMLDEFYHNYSNIN